MYIMCLATKAYFLRRSLCNTSHRPLKAYILLNACLILNTALKLFKQNINHTLPHILFQLVIVEEETTHHLNGTGNNVQI